MESHFSPNTVLPLLGSATQAIYEALVIGIGFADHLQPDPNDINRHFWAHSARYGAWRHLGQVESNSWRLVPDVPNFGVHLVFAELHTLRLVRSLSNTVPPPGRNIARRVAWTGYSEQLAFEMASAEDGQSTFPPLSLIADWRLDAQGEPSIFVSLPEGPWQYGQNPRCHWRVPLPSNSSTSLDDLYFEGEDGGDPTIQIEVDPMEWGGIEG